LNKGIWSKHKIQERNNLTYPNSYGSTSGYNAYSSDFTEKKGILILAHPGAFILDSKDNYYIQKLAKDLARTGLYHTASIDYHKIPLDINNIVDLVGQDEFINKNVYQSAADVGYAFNYISSIDDINVDTENIWLLGYSAGAIAANTLIFTSPDEASPIKNTSTSIFSKDNKKIAGLISISGGLPDYSIINDFDLTGFEFLMFHGTNDQIVPIGQGKPFQKYVKKTKIELPSLYYDIGIAVEGDVDSNISIGSDFGIQIPAYIIKAFVNGFTEDVCGSECIFSNLINSPQISFYQIENGTHTFFQSKNSTFNRNYLHLRDIILKKIKRKHNERRKEIRRSQRN